LKQTFGWNSRLAAQARAGYWMMNTTPWSRHSDITLLYRSGNGERLDLTPF
jgi:hypothetical protein